MDKYFSLIFKINKNQKKYGLKRKEYDLYRKFCTRKLNHLKKYSNIYKERNVKVSVHLKLERNLILIEKIWTFIKESLDKNHKIKNIKSSKGKLNFRRKKSKINLNKKFKKVLKLIENLKDKTEENFNSLINLDIKAYFHWIEAEYSRYFLNWNNSFFNYTNAQLVYKLLLKLKILPKSLAKKKLKEITLSISVCLHNLTRSQKELKQCFKKIKLNINKKQEEIENKKFQEKIQINNFLCINWLGSCITITENTALQFFKQNKGMFNLILKDSNPIKKASQHLKLIMAFKSLQNISKLKLKIKLKKYSKFFIYLHNLFRTWLILNYILHLNYYYPNEIGLHWKNFREVLKPLIQGNYNKKIINEIFIMDSISELMIGYMVGQSHLDAGNNENSYILAQYIEKKARKLYERKKNLVFIFLPECLSLLKKLIKQTIILQITGKMYLIMNGFKAKKNMINQMKEFSFSRKSYIKLKDRLHKFVISNINGQYDICMFSPEFRIIINKPVFLDVAHHFIKFPELEIKKTKKFKKKFFNYWWH